MIDTEKLRNKWRVIDEDTKRAMKTGEEFYRWTVTPDMPADVFELLAEIDYLKNEQIYWRQENDRLRKQNERFYKALTGELRIIAEKDGKVIADLKGVRIESDNEV